MPASPRHPTVLIVNDNEDTREALAYMVRQRGYDVLFACDGAEALGTLRAGAPACIILLDLMMPVMDGFKFREEQLADPEIAHIPVIVLSAVDDVSSNSARISATAFVQITGPVRVLLEQMDRHCLK